MQHEPQRHDEPTEEGERGGAARRARRPSRRDLALERLAGVPLFASLSKSDLRQVLKAAKQLDAPGGRTFVREDLPGDTFTVILDGKAKVTRKGRRIAELGPGSWFGELALLDGGPRNATVIALTDMQLIVLRRRPFLRLLDDVPGFARKLLAGAAARLRDADRAAIE